MISPLNVAIDGPAGSGKSTVARKVAHKLGSDYTYIDTGALYRAITYQALINNIDLANEAAVVEIAINTSLSFDSEQKILINGQSRSEEIRSPEVSRSVSLVAAYANIRKYILVYLRKLAKQGGVIMDGRDIGSYVLPEADVKIFLTAEVEERAIRRANELMQKNYTVDVEVLKKEIVLRDKMDSEREESPLTKAEDAIIIDTTNLTIDEVVLKIINICNGEQREKRIDS